MLFFSFPLGLLGVVSWQISFSLQRPFLGFCLALCQILVVIIHHKCNHDQTGPMDRKILQKVDLVFIMVSITSVVNIHIYLTLTWHKEIVLNCGSCSSENNVNIYQIKYDMNGKTHWIRNIHDRFKTFLFLFVFILIKSENISAISYRNDIMFFSLVLQ